MTVKIESCSDNSFERKRKYSFSFPSVTATSATREDFQATKVRKVTTAGTQTERVTAVTAPVPGSVCSAGTPVNVTATLAYEGEGISEYIYRSNCNS